MSEDINERTMKYLLEKRYKDLCDKIKIMVIDKLIELSELKEPNVILKEELVYIRDEIEKIRNKEKEEELNTIAYLINDLISRGDNGEQRN